MHLYATRGCSKNGLDGLKHMQWRLSSAPHMRSYKIIANGGMRIRGKGK